MDISFHELDGRRDEHGAASHETRAGRTKGFWDESKYAAEGFTATDVRVFVT